MNFLEILSKFNWDEIGEKIDKITPQDVEKVLEKEVISEQDFLALVSKAGENYLEIFAKKSKERTQRRFGKTIQLYLPLYLSNVCTNQCVYCGFNHTNKIKRIILSDEQILREVIAIKQMGYEHILLVTGEASKKVGADYLESAIKLIKPSFASISAEIQPLEVEEYKRLIAAGLNSVYIYQETYNQEKYPFYHLKGKKRDFAYRLATPERLGEAGIYRIGLGALLGLENWRVEAFFMALHLRFLQKRFWKTKYSLSFPRMRPYEGQFLPPNPVSEKELAQLIWAFRIFDEDVEISLSTRESQNFRDNMMTLGVTSMSAGSKTEPGGYASCVTELEQFEINDNREASELEAAIKQHGYEAVWKDWDKVFS